MKTNYYLNFEYINIVLQEREISEEQLAEKMGVTSTRLHGYLTRYRERVPFKIFVGIRIILDIPFDKLVVTIITTRKNA